MQGVVDNLSGKSAVRTNGSRLTLLNPSEMNPARLCLRKTFQHSSCRDLSQQGPVLVQIYKYCFLSMPHDIFTLISLLLYNKDIVRVFPASFADHCVLEWIFAAMRALFSPPRRVASCSSSLSQRSCFAETPRLACAGSTPFPCGSHMTCTRISHTLFFIALTDSLSSCSPGLGLFALHVLDGSLEMAVLRMLCLTSSSWQL